MLAGATPACKKTTPSVHALASIALPHEYHATPPPLLRSRRATLHFSLAEAQAYIIDPSSCLHPANLRNREGGIARQLGMAIFNSKSASRSMPASSTRLESISKHGQFRILRKPRRVIHCSLQKSSKCTFPFYSSILLFTSILFFHSTLHSHVCLMHAIFKCRDVPATYTCT